MAFKQPTRADDETLLHWLQLRDEGYSTGQIAAHYGTTPTRVRSATNRVYVAEAKEVAA